MSGLLGLPYSISSHPVAPNFSGCGGPNGGLGRMDAMRNGVIFLMLSDAKARRLKPDDKPVSDGTITGLYLVPAGKVGTGKWILRFVSPVLQKRREMGLGSYPTTPIRDARIRALEARNLIEEGTDPLEERKAKQEALARLAAMPTFEEAARCHHEDRDEGFRNAKHRAQ